MYMISTKRFAPLCFVLLLTLVALAAGALCLPAAAAAETPSAGDYMVTTGNTLTLYDGNTNQPVLEVPATYYVTLKSAEATGGCYSVAYAGKTYSVKTADFTARTALHDEEKYGAVPAENKYYAFDKSAVFAADAQLTFYFCENGAIVAEPTVNGAGSSVTEIYGLVTIGGSVYYSVDTRFMQDMTVYVASSQASGEFATLTPAGIAANPYESEKAEIDAQTAGVSDQDGSNGSADASDPADTSNNLERIILSVVIAVLCVAVVLLIFRPGAKKKQ